MSRPVRRVGAFLALSGLLSLSALGGVTALHVLLEHEGHRDTLAHAHGAAGTTSDDTYPLVRGGPDPGHSHQGSRDLQDTEAPSHDHVLMLTADLQPRSGRLGAAPFSYGVADATPSPSLGTVPLPLWQPSRAGPAPRAAPLARRSVVLQL